MRVLSCLFMIILLGCSAAKPTTSSNAAFSNRILFVETVNEPGMGTAVFNGVSKLQIKEIQMNSNGCCLLLEYSFVNNNTHAIDVVVQQLKMIKGVLNIRVK